MCDFDVIEENFANDSCRCVCKNAVFNAYNGLVGAGQSHRHAMDAAMKVYRYHHPQDSAEAAEQIVERWILSQTVH